MSIIIAIAALVLVLCAAGLIGSMIGRSHAPLVERRFDRELRSIGLYSGMTGAALVIVLGFRTLVGRVSAPNFVKRAFF